MNHDTTSAQGDSDASVTALSVGLAVGEGSGPELAEVFESTLRALARLSGIELRVIRSPHRFRTSGGLADLSVTEIERVSREDAEIHESFLRELVAADGRVAFRTAFNAQSLYRVRERLLCVKLDCVATTDGQLMLVRDQAQGFYAGDNHADTGPDAIRRTCEFSKATTFRILDFARAEAARRWGGERAIDHVLLVYKFHLLDVRFASWISEYGRSRGVEVRLFQPDTANRCLEREDLRGNLLIVGANEWGDNTHVERRARPGAGSPEHRCARNHYLAPGLDGLVEFQTAHGSADDIAGRGIVNPTATLRAAAAILEEHGGARGLAARLEEALARAAARGLATPDAGGTASTRALADFVVADVSRPGESVRPVFAGAPAAALAIVDMQNDFCAARGHFSALGLIDPAATERLAERLRRLIAAARASAVPVVFVRTLADDDLVPPTVAARNLRMGRIGCVQSGQWGSAFFGVAPLPGEKIVTKQAYDAFLRTDLETHLRATGIARVVVAGVFTDVCVDALARTGYQSGFSITVVSDGTLPLERDQQGSLDFMSRFYDARIAPCALLIESWSGSAVDASPLDTCAAT